MKQSSLAKTVILAGLLLQTSASFAMDGNDSIPAATVPCDSVAEAITLSDGEGNNTGLLKGIIPPAPQSMALARYAEYPVSHTTGIPDISIPLYEIRVGEFTLPISVSYHAAGARVDDVPTCVGQGWTLNAGGAVIRTVMGAPDNPSGTVQDHRYMDIEEMRRLISDKVGAAQYSYHHILSRLLCNDKYYDTESDRYSYNVAGLSGLFRYDIEKEEFTTLDHAPHMISFLSDGAESRFIIHDGVGNDYELGKNEVSCLSDDGNGNEYTTAWYVDSISTPYGNIGFSYLPGDLSFNVIKSSTSTEAGHYPFKNASEYGGLENFVYKIAHSIGDIPPRPDSCQGNQLGRKPHMLQLQQRQGRLRAAQARLHDRLQQ